MGIPPLARGCDRNIMLLLLVVVVVVFLLHGRSKLLNATGGRNAFLIDGGNGIQGLVHVCALYNHSETGRGGYNYHNIVTSK